MNLQFRKACGLSGTAFSQQGLQRQTASLPVAEIFCYRGPVKITFGDSLLTFHRKDDNGKKYFAVLWNLSGPSRKNVFGAACRQDAEDPVSQEATEMIHAGKRFDDASQYVPCVKGQIRKARRLF